MSPMRRCPRSACARRSPPWRACSARSARTTRRSELVLNKVDLLDPAARRRLDDRFPGALQVSAATRRGPRCAARTDRRAVRRSLRGGAAARPARGRARAWRTCMRSARRSTSATTPMTACSSARALPQRDLRRFARYLVASSGTPTAGTVIELPVVLLRAGAALPARPYEGDAGLDLTACERVVLEPGQARRRPDRDRRRDTRGPRRVSSCPARGLPRSTASRSSTHRA